MDSLTKELLDMQYCGAHRKPECENCDTSVDSLKDGLCNGCLVLAEQYGQTRLVNA